MLARWVVLLYGVSLGRNFQYSMVQFKNSFRHGTSGHQVPAYNKKMAGLLCRAGLSLFHCCTVLVRMVSDVAVRSAATQMRVRGWQVLSRVSISWLLR